MGYVKLRPDLNARVAETFGGRVTRPHALKVQARAKALADMRAKHSSVATVSTLTFTLTARIRAWS